jgi:hypothetical protein
MRKAKLYLYLLRGYLKFSLGKDNMRTSKLYTPGVIILSLASLVENLAYALPMSYFPNYVQLLGASVAYIGFFTAAFLQLLSPQQMQLSLKSLEACQTELEEKDLSKPVCSPMSF